jgi:tetratricopeptide (TPR) repeat protein
LEEISDFESIQLFTERASLTLTSFILTQENIQAVVEVCRKLDGIPLAIELAAARVNILQVEEIVAQLQDSFTLLASDIRGSLPRHQTLQASLEWSWGLLSEAEQILLRQLSVFAGGWTLEAARAVCDGAVLDLSGALVKKSLIVVNQELGRDTRYRFHEMVRAFAHEKLVKSGEEEKIRTRHLKYFVNLAEKAQAELFSSTRIDWMERLNDERNNLRAALHWTDQTNTEAGLVLSSRLMRYWESCNLPEGRQWLETFLQKEDAKNFPLAQAYAVHAQAWLLTWLQNFDQAYTMAEECLATFRAAGDRQSEVDALLLVANILQFKYELDTAQKIGMQALALARSLGDTWREANALFYLGWDTRDYERIFDNLGKAISLYRKVGDQVSLANTLGVMGQFRVFHGDVDLGETCGKTRKL